MAQPSLENVKDSQTSWVRARQFANLLNPIPFTVSSAIQNLWTNHIDNVALSSNDIWDESEIAIRQVDRSAKLKTPIYFAAMALHPELFGDTKEDDASKALLKILGPGMFAVILGLVYLHRRCIKIINHEDWGKLSEELVTNMEIGHLTGTTLTELGPVSGMLIGGIRYAALATLLLWTPQHYVRYRKTKRRALDLEYERSVWGCDHAQITACLIRALGYRNDVHDMTRAFRGDDMEGAPRDLHTWKIGIEWMETIKWTGKSPGLNNAPLGSTQSSAADLVDEVNEIMKDGNSFSWMLKTSKDSPNAAGASE
ncbi:MAG: hypothetical protein RL417_2182 [Pseudomonadota bacterium]|jgi:hypothetical protein